MAGLLVRTLFLVSGFLALSIDADATPIVRVTSESVVANYQIEVYRDGAVTTFSDSASGSLLGSGASVRFIPGLRYHHPNSNYPTTISATALAYGSYNSFSLEARAQDYPSGWDFEQTTPVYDSSSVGAEASVHWTFSLEGGDALFSSVILPDRTLGMITSVSLFDLTDLTQVIDLSISAGYHRGDSASATLISGHQYSLDARAYDFEHDDAHTKLGFSFDSSVEIIPEPASLTLLIGGWILLPWMKRIRGV